jgi:RNA polymerase sigma factor (TIGR02999 family)
MRAILKDHWRRKRARKRGGKRQPLPLGDHEPTAQRGDEFEQFEFLDLDQALDRLEQRNDRWFSVAMHRYFGGRTVEETAELLGLSPATVKKDWQLARGWLRRELAGGSENGP